jgi:hypothetical protein
MRAPFAHWSRKQLFGLLGVLVALIGSIAAVLVVPEVRRAIGLESTELSPLPQSSTAGLLWPRKHLRKQ